MRDENGLLRNRLDFLRGLYQDMLDDRRQLRDQIIGRRDSFGKLYAVTRELDEVQPQKLYHTAIRIMQESLDSGQPRHLPSGQRRTVRPSCGGEPTVRRRQLPLRTRLGLR